MLSSGLLPVSLTLFIITYYFSFWPSMIWLPCTAMKSSPTGFYQGPTLSTATSLKSPQRQLERLTGLWRAIRRLQTWSASTRCRPPSCLIQRTTAWRQLTPSTMWPTQRHGLISWEMLSCLLKRFEPLLQRQSEFIIKYTRCVLSLGVRIQNAGLKY